MLTIRHIEKDLGDETIVQGLEVSATPAKKNRQSGDAALITSLRCIVHDYTGVSERLFNAPGKIYIMNDAGKTVAGYEIIHED